MLKEAIDRIVALGDERLHVEKVGGLSYARVNYALIVPPRAAPLKFHGLAGFVDFVKTREVDYLASSPECVRVHVVSPWLVRLIGPILGEFRDREYFAEAVNPENAAFKFGVAMDSESFNIALATLFDETPDRERVIKLVGNMSSEKATTSTDNGFSQSVGQKVGVTLVNRETIANPFNLSPHRTFPEVAQPLTPFILRVHNAGPDTPPKPALYECDNGAWKVEAVKSVAAWIRDAFVVAKISVEVLA